ncbi:probable ion channel SYM8 isoform X3 [Mangifera indica]|uniref:probable ion channel SYM8 isoform X3 n=1 Tax=Mangifera indica TaxID=29780 RepID=UPI001CFBF41F|nr:probable ion channel SYM8 isoform X3 [Mangifera indica]
MQKSDNTKASPVAAERPPRQKRTKTIPQDTHFHGPLFPAVRRNSTAKKPPSDLRVFIESESSSLPSNRGNATPSSRSSSSNGSTGFNVNSFGERDWMYPSFLGPHMGRSGVKVKGNKAQKPLTISEELKKEEEVTEVVAVSQTRTQTQSTSVSQTRTQIQAQSSARTPGVKNSLVYYLLIFSCVFFASYVIYLQDRNVKLEDENSKLRRACSIKGIVENESTRVLQLEQSNSTSNFGNADSRVIALYTVVVTLSVPFVLYKYLDYLPQIKNFSKRTKIKKEEAPLKKRIAYRVDVCFSVYPYAKLLALLFATIYLIIFGGLALYAVSDSSFAEALWLSWSFVADSGNHADRVGIGPRIVSVSISSGGMLIFAMMLGLVSDAISEKVDSLRKGKSEVIEKNHILILGWSDKLGSLLKQLAVANMSVGGGVIVVLAERDKEEMEMDIAKLEFDLMGTSVICRSGSPLILADLKKVSVSKARAIIVLASDENADQSDAHALRVVLSLTGVKEGLRGHVVVEMSDVDNEPLVKLVGGELIETVVAHDVIGRLMIQCALQPGLAQIWEDILGFENAEFYIKRWPQLDGLRFEEVLISFPDAVPCGIKVAADNGKIILNPDDNYVLKEGDEILVIAEDDDTYAPGSLPEVRRHFFPKIPDPPKYPEKILFCGWRRDIDDMIMVLEAFLAPGSELWMLNEVPEKEREKKLNDGGLDISRLENLKLVHREGNAVIRRHLENLPLETFDSILILADESLEDSIVHSDSRSLATLLLIRDIQRYKVNFPTAIWVLSQLMDS